MTAYKTVRMDFPELKLPDGRRADALDRFQLFFELEKLGVAEIKNEMGKVVLLQRYADHLEATKTDKPYGLQEAQADMMAGLEVKRGAA